jgi:hypothetical protein
VIHQSGLAKPGKGAPHGDEITLHAQGRDGSVREELAAGMTCRPGFRTIQVHPKDLPMLPQQPERAVSCTVASGGGAPCLI